MHPAGEIGSVIRKCFYLIMAPSKEILKEKERAFIRSMRHFIISKSNQTYFQSESFTATCAYYECLWTIN